MDLENLLYRIINGYYFINTGGTTYKVVPPSVCIKQNAHQLYLNTIDDYKFDTSSWTSENTIKNLLKIYNIWDEKNDKEFENISDQINKTKVQLFLHYQNSTLKKQLKQSILELNNQLDDYYNKKHYFDYLTLEYYAQSIKNQYIITNMIYDSNNKQIFNTEDFNNIDSVFLEKILSEIQKNTISSEKIKTIARSEIWRSFWNISKENVFDGKIKDWTDEQRSLVNFTKVLDSIREHMECPSEDILNDNDALDGWIYYQNDKSEKEKKRKHISDKFGLDKKQAGEVFVISSDADERKSIYELNDPQTNKDIKNMTRLAKEKGNIDWAELPHVKRDLRQQILENGKKS